MVDAKTVATCLGITLVEGDQIVIKTITKEEWEEEKKRIAKSVEEEEA